MPARRPIPIHRLAVAATALSSSSSSSSSCSVSVSASGIGIGNSSGAASGFFDVSSINFFVGRERRAFAFISTRGASTTTWHRSPRAARWSLVRKSRNLSSSMQSTPLSSPPTTWSDLLTTCDAKQEEPWTTYAHNLFPPLTSSSHKGSHGRIAILGGSEKYTGAPFYAAQSALHCGVDLVSIYCASEACIPIKCYSPELMVQGVYSIKQLELWQKEGTETVNELEKCKQQNNNTNNELTDREPIKKSDFSEDLVQSKLRQKSNRIEVLSKRLATLQSLEEKLTQWKVKENAHITDIVSTITSNFNTLHTLCIGPGLGRHPLVFSVVEKVIYKAIEYQLMLVLDADVLYMLSLKEYRTVLEELTKYERCVMTPNLMEMRRLHEAFTSLGIESSNNILVQKGHVDTISYATNITMQCKEEGGLKRSGGIGDVLAGAISAFMAWNAILEKVDNEVASDAAATAIDGRYVKDEQRQQKQRLFAAWTAATLVKKATKLAFDKKRRSMSAINVIDEISNVLGGMEDGLMRN